MKHNSNPSTFLCFITNNSVSPFHLAVNDSLSSTLLPFSLRHPITLQKLQFRSLRSIQLSYLLPLVLLAFEFCDFAILPTLTQSVHLFNGIRWKDKSMVV
ncbi:hypothetical protein P8452_42912 [Trifolium repens]|nr:hypothetical protein P8452_42912 [Trifolium repens]